MDVKMILCDFAQPAEGKLTIVGGGWTITGPDPAPMAIGLLFEIPMDSANYPHSFNLRVRDTEGNAVLDPNGQPIVVDGQFEVARMPGTPPGVPLTFPAGLNFGPLPLAPATRYVWELTVDGDDEHVWQAAFNTRPAHVGAAS